MFQLDGHGLEVIWNMLGHKGAICWRCSSCDTFKRFHFHRGGAVTADRLLEMGWYAKWRPRKRKGSEQLLVNSLTLEAEKLRRPTGICARPFVSVLSNVPQFTWQWMFLYKRWEGNGVKNWCSWVSHEEARLGRIKGAIQGTLSVKSFNYAAMFMPEQ